MRLRLVPLLILLAAASSCGELAPENHIGLVPTQAAQVEPTTELVDNGEASLEPPDELAASSASPTPTPEMLEEPEAGATPVSDTPTPVPDWNTSDEIQLEEATATRMAGEADLEPPATATRTPPPTRTPQPGPTASPSGSSSPTPTQAVPKPTAVVLEPQEPYIRPPTNARSDGFFVVLDYPEILPGREVDYLDPDELVLGLEMGGESRAYPARMAWFHHIFNDEIGGTPVLVTY